MNIDSYFTKQTDVKSIILNYLNKATKQVNVAVAWFTERTLFEKLIQLQDRGVNVEVIITSHEFNRQCSNQFELIEKRGGFFAEIGNDEQLMHMKFCIIDFDVVISGSANWSNRAFNENNEEVTIVTGNFQRANDFIAEFERLKLLSGKVQNLQKELDVSAALKIFDVIKALLNLGDSQAIQPYIHQLKKFTEIESITQHLIAGRFDMAIEEIDEFKKQYTQIVSVFEVERLQLQIQIKLLSFQIEAIEIEKVQAEALLEQFNHRYIIELNPLIAKLLSLKKKVFEKLKKHGIIDETFEKLDEEFKSRTDEYNKEKEIKIPKLNEEEEKSIKQMYREAAGLCHPDSPNCIFEDRKKAGDVFSNLSSAYKANDLAKVKYIWSELKLGKPLTNLEQFNELEYLRAKLETLKMKYNILVNEFQLIKTSETFQFLEKIRDWDEYFESQKVLLQNEYDELTEKYVKNEQ